MDFTTLILSSAINHWRLPASVYESAKNAPEHIYMTKFGKKYTEKAGAYNTSFTSKIAGDMMAESITHKDLPKDLDLQNLACILMQLDIRLRRLIDDVNDSRPTDPFPHETTDRAIRTIAGIRAHLENSDSAIDDIRIKAWEYRFAYISLYARYYEFKSEMETADFTYNLEIEENDGTIRFHPYRDLLNKLYKMEHDRNLLLVLLDPENKHFETIKNQILAINDWITELTDKPFVESNKTA